MSEHRSISRCQQQEGDIFQHSIFRGQTVLLHYNENFLSVLHCINLDGRVDIHLAMKTVFILLLFTSLSFFLHVILVHMRALLCTRSYTSTDENERERE